MAYAIVTPGKLVRRRFRYRRSFIGEKLPEPQVSLLREFGGANDAVMRARFDAVMGEGASVRLSPHDF